MGIYHFAIQHNGKFHKCNLDEEGTLWIPDETGQPKPVNGPKITEHDHARLAALIAIRQNEHQ